MKILVAIKRTLDPGAHVRVNADGSGVDIAGLKMSTNPFDEVAIEAALKLKEAGQATEIVVVSIGTGKTPDTLRAALAMGADRAIHIEHDGELEPLAVAGLLRVAVEREQPGLAILGKQAIDSDNGQTGQMLAGLLGWGQATYASEIVVTQPNVTVTRETDAGLQVIELVLPAVITTDLRLNTPRFASLPMIMKAKQKPIEKLQAADLGVALTLRLQVVATTPPRQRSAGVVVADVAELVRLLRDEAGVI